MGLVDKMKGLLNPGSKEGFEDDEEMYGNEDNNMNYYDDAYQPQQNYVQQPQNVYAQPVQAQQTGMTLNSNALELKVVKPESFESVNQIADHLLNRRTVVLNLEETDRETSRRLIDFLTGVAYSIKGTIKRVAKHTFVITPNNVGVSGVPLQENQPRQPQQPEEDDLYSEL